MKFCYRKSLRPMLNGDLLQLARVKLGFLMLA